MLEGLFGSKNIQRILFFLFVNGKCYGTQLQNALKTSLTPLQKALQRLEKGGIIKSYFEGKTRIYQFDPMFPCIDELEPLLKKAYSLLSASEKRQYLTVQESLGTSETGPCLQRLWEKLSLVDTLKFQAKSNTHHEGAWNGKGEGAVIVSKEGASILIFEEKGSWLNKKNERIEFCNIFRWTLDRKKRMISLEHLRFGKTQPVFLCHMTPSGATTLSSVDSHLCDGDIYFGQIFFTEHIVRLNWRVIGPKKNEMIDCHYAVKGWV